MFSIDYYTPILITKDEVVVRGNYTNKLFFRNIKTEKIRESWITVPLPFPHKQNIVLSENEKYIITHFYYPNLTSDVYLIKNPEGLDRNLTHKINPKFSSVVKDEIFMVVKDEILYGNISILYDNETEEKFKVINVDEFSSGGNLIDLIPGTSIAILKFLNGDKRIALKDIKSNKELISFPFKTYDFQLDLLRSSSSGNLVFICFKTGGRKKFFFIDIYGGCAKIRDICETLKNSIKIIIMGDIFYSNSFLSISPNGRYINIYNGIFDFITNTDVINIVPVYCLSNYKGICGRDVYSLNHNTTVNLIELSMKDDMKGRKGRKALTQSLPHLQSFYRNPIHDNNLFREISEFLDGMGYSKPVRLFQIIRKTLKGEFNDETEAECDLFRDVL